MMGRLRVTRNDRKLEYRSGYKTSGLGGRGAPLSLEELMLLTVELWVVGLLLYHLGLSALGI